MKSLALAALLVACHVDDRFDTLTMKQPAVEDPTKVTAWQLKNGLRVALLRDSRARLASIDVRYEVGASDDPYGKPGYALLVGEALIAAGAALPDVELTTALTVDLDHTELATTAIDLDGALTIAARRMAVTCDDFTPEVLAKAKDHAQQQLTGIPPSFLQAVWGQGHPYAHELGNPDLAQITPEQVCEFYKAHYAASSATLVVTGSVGTDVPGKLEQAFGAMPLVKLPARAAVPVLTPTTQAVRQVVWGLGQPTAIRAYPMPAVGDLDDVMVDIQLRRLDQLAQRHKAQLHTAVIGGGRGRVLVIGLEAETERGLADAHDKIRDILDDNAAMGGPDEPNEVTSDDQLQEAQNLDDVFERGGKIADLVASGRKVELLRRVRAFASAKHPSSWMRTHMIEAPTRVMNLIPAVPGTGVSIEQLAEIGATTDRSLAGVYAPSLDAAADPGAGTIRAFDRPADAYTLPNGLHVVLASDPMATTIDVRLVFPVGSKAEPAPGIATRAATDLIVDDGFSTGGNDAHDRVEWYGQSATVHTDVDVTQTSTHFRAVGFTGLGDWHLFAIAWHVIKGHYDLAPLSPFRRNYQPKTATLIVSGGFNPAAAKDIILRWYGPWKAPVGEPSRPVAAATRRVTTYDPSESQQTVDVDLAYGPEPHPGDHARGAGHLLATLIQQRLALSTRTSAAITVSYDSRDHRLLLQSQIDPEDAARTVRMIVGELAALRASGTATAELARARRKAVAQLLAAEVTPSGRGRALEATAIAKLSPNDDSSLAELQAATADDVTEAARQLIDPGTLDATIRAPKTSLPEVVKALGFDPKTAERR